MSVEHGLAFIVAAAQCAKEMRENAEYILENLDDVTTSDTLRSAIQQRSNFLIATYPMW